MFGFFNTTQTQFRVKLSVAKEVPVFSVDTEELITLTQILCIHSDQRGRDAGKPACGVLAPIPGPGDSGQGSVETPRMRGGGGTKGHGFGRVPRNPPFLPQTVPLTHPRHRRPPSPCGGPGAPPGRPRGAGSPDAAHRPPARAWVHCRPLHRPVRTGGGAPLTAHRQNSLPSPAFRVQYGIAPPCGMKRYPTVWECGFVFRNNLLTRHEFQEPANIFGLTSTVFRLDSDLRFCMSGGTAPFPCKEPRMSNSARDTPVWFCPSGGCQCQWCIARFGGGAKFEERLWCPKVFNPTMLVHLQQPNTVLW